MPNTKHLRDALADAVFKPRISDEKLAERIEAIKRTLPIPVIWLLGKAQSGKTSLIRALTGRDDTEIGRGTQAHRPVPVGPRDLRSRCLREYPLREASSKGGGSASGSHAQLMSQGGLYARLAALQFDHFKASKEAGSVPNTRDKFLLSDQ